MFVINKYFECINNILDLSIYFFSAIYLSIFFTKITTLKTNIKKLKTKDTEKNRFKR